MNCKMTVWHNKLQMTLLQNKLPMTLFHKLQNVSFTWQTTKWFFCTVNYAITVINYKTAKWLFTKTTNACLTQAVFRWFQFGQFWDQQFSGSPNLVICQISRDDSSQFATFPIWFGLWLKFKEFPFWSMKNPLVPN